MSKIPFYKESGPEKLVFQKARELKLPLLLKGPTGCGKSRFIEALAAENDLKLIKVSCNEDTSASDLLGRFLLKGNETIWQDGPVTRAVRMGALLYLDEIAEAREDVIVALHSLTDDRRELYLDRINETLHAPSDFMMIASFNPGYQSRLKELKPSTRQRFITLQFQYPNPEIEAEIIQKETNCDLSLANKLAQIAKKIRSLTELNLRETISTRVLVHAAHLSQKSLHPRLACQVAIVQILTDDAETATALQDLCNLYL